MHELSALQKTKTEEFGMNIMIASDIHGSEYYCSKLLEAYKKEGCKRLILLGDILYHGPRNDLTYMYNPKAVISMLNKMSGEITSVRGNCDAEVDNMVLDFDVSAGHMFFYINDTDYCATHGHLSLPELSPGTVVLYGHTHIPVFEKKDGIFYLNPGSVSIPKGGSERGYIIINENTPVRKTLDGEISFTAEIK